MKQAEWSGRPGSLVTWLGRVWAAGGPGRAEAEGRGRSWASGPRRAAVAGGIALAVAGCGRKQTTEVTPTSSVGAQSAAVSAAPAVSASAQRCIAQSAKRMERASAVAASSSIAIVKAGGKRLAIVADYDEKALQVVDLTSMKQVGVTPLPGRPGHVLAMASGLVAVALRDTGRVVLLEPADDGLTKAFEERCSAEAPIEPWALAEEGPRLLVASGFGAALTLFQKDDLTVERRIPLPREPRSLLVVNEGTTAFVSHSVGGIVSAVDLADPTKAPEQVKLKAGRRALEKGEPTTLHPRESSQSHAMAVIEGRRTDGKTGALRLLVPNLSVDPGAPDSGPSSGYGGPSFARKAQAPVVSVLDPIAKRSITSDPMREETTTTPPDCLLPRGAVADEKGLFVACIDLDAVIELDPWLVDPIFGERRRFALPAGVSAVALTEDGTQIIAYSEFDRALSRIDRESGTITAVGLWRRAGETRDAKVERGRRLFHTSRDARLGRGHPCAGCHPDGRDDGLIWTSPAGRRQTPILAGRLQGTGPYGWFGESRTLQEHVRKTFDRLGGTGLDEAHGGEDLDALLAYVLAMPAPPRAAPADAALVARGKEVFAASCDRCHKGGDSNGVGFDLGTGNPRERPSVAAEPGCKDCHKAPPANAPPRKDHPVIFDVPSLRAVRGSAPYFHDGRYATLDEVLSARDNTMITPPLENADKTALTAYLETL